MKPVNRIWIYFSLIPLVIWHQLDVKAQEDLVKIRLSPEEIKQGDSLSVISCEITNNRQDSIVILQSPFLIEGDTFFSRRPHIWLDDSSIVNVLYYEPIGKNLAFPGDGGYRPIFHQFPKLLILSPRQKASIKLLLKSNQIELLRNSNFYFWGVFTYGVKRELDKLTKPYPHFWQQYRNALSISRVTHVSVVDSLARLEKNEEHFRIFQILQEGMKFKVNSPRQLTRNTKK